MGYTLAIQIINLCVMCGLWFCHSHDACRLSCRNEPHIEDIRTGMIRVDKECTCLFYVANQIIGP